LKVGLDPDGWGGFDSVGFVLALPCSTLSEGPKALVQYGHSLFDDRCSMPLGKDPLVVPPLFEGLVWQV